ncbi:MAG: hypothetical protein ACPGLY_15330, partial [Rubripirellula sp.]
AGAGFAGAGAGFAEAADAPPGIRSDFSQPGHFTTFPAAASGIFNALPQLHLTRIGIGANEGIGEKK